MIGTRPEAGGDPPGAGAGEGLPRELRLRHRSGFDDAYIQNRKVVGRHMVMFVRSAPDAALRLGVVTSRKVGGAVARNRARRRLREVFRRERARLAGKVDVVLVARAAAREPPFEELRREFLSLCRRAGLTPPKPNGGGAP